MTGRSYRVDDMTFCSGLLGDGRTQSRDRIHIQLVLSPRFVLLETRYEPIGVSENFLNGTGHGHHLRYF